MIIAEHEHWRQVVDFQGDIDGYILGYLVIEQYLFQKMIFF